MPRGTRIDKDALYDLIKEGRDAQDIMKELGIATKQTLKMVLADLMVEKDEVLIVQGMRGRRSGNRRINKVGLIIPLAQLSPHKRGDEFKMVVDKNSITLTKV